MFKKLKQKINEEQSPQRNAQSPQQAQVGPGERPSSHTLSLHHDHPSSPSDREMLAGMIAEPAFLSEYTIFALDHSKRPKSSQVASASGTRGVARSPRGSINGDGSASPQREEPQSFAQKLQLRVPSVESLLRGASRAESLFRSPSKESLVRSSSRDSLTPLGESDPQASSPAYDPPSDIESEAEESSGNAESLTKEQMLQRLHRVEKSLANYRGKYSELVTTYRTVQRDKEKTQAILSQSQDKALRRIGELREELQMDQQAKKHLQEDFDAALEEKDQLISVLRTQNSLMKKRLKGVPGGVLPPEGEVSQSEDAVDSTSTPQSPTKDPATNEGEGSSDPGKVMEALQKRVTRQENLLQKCKDMLRVHKERSTQLGSENETLQQQLQERLQELEKMKELHTVEKTKLITQLRDAKNLIEQLEQDKGMVIAETKRQMHETLELKEEEVAQLRSRLQHAAAQKEELQEQKEKSDKAAFEELERALGVAQRAEEARKQLQAQLEEQVKEVERTSEEERKSLQLELTRVKQEVVTIMKKSAEEKVSELERLHSEALAAKDQELTARISEALEQCKEEYDQTAREREQQTALALEDVELQKAAMETEAGAKVKQIRLELEAARTRILELESSVEKSPQDGLVQNDELSSQMEELKTKHAEGLTALEQRHKEQLDRFKQEQDTLALQHNDALQELQEKHADEVANILKDKELQFHAHVEDINQKTLEKLDLKQAELESLSSELSEALENKQLLEEKLSAAEDTCRSSSHALEQRLQEEVAKHNAEIESMKQQHEKSLGGIEKTLKEDVNRLNMVLQDKETELQEHILREKTLKEESEKLLQERNVLVKDVEEVRETLTLARSEKKGLEDTGAQFSKISEEMAQCKLELNNLQHQLVVTQTDCKEKEASLQQRLKEMRELENQLLQTKKNLSDQEKSFHEELNSKVEQEKHLQKQLEDQKAAQEKKLENHKKEMEGRIKAQETKFDKFKQKTKEMQEKFKKKLQEKEDSMKTELAKKETELQQKEQQVKEKILEVAQKSSEGMSSAMSELEANHKEQLQSLRCVHKQESEDLERHWQEKLRHQEEEMQEKYTSIQQEKAQEMEEVAQKLSSSSEENEQARQELRDLKEELAIRETTVQKLQAELKKAAVNLDSLSQGEVLLKEQVEAIERNLNQALNERNSLQDELSKSEEKSRGKITALSEQLREVRGEVKALKTSRSKEGDLHRKLEESARQLQAKDIEFQNQSVAVSRQLDHFCQEVQAKMEVGTNDLCERVDGRVKELKERVLYNQKRVAHLKNLILSKVDSICTLEKQLQQQREENGNLCSSLEQMTAQLNVHTDQIKALTHERECLQKDAMDHSQSLSEKIRKIEQLWEENKTISDCVKTNVVHISNLESIINDLKTQLASSLGEKDQAISLLDQQQKEERQRLVCQMEETIRRLEQEKDAAVEQVDTLRNNLSELKRKAESKFTLNHNTVKSLQTRLEDMEKEMAEKNKALQSLTDDMDNQSISKSEMDQALSEKERMVRELTVEVETCNSRLCDLEEQLTLRSKECVQLIADLKQQDSVRENEKRELTKRLQQTQEQFTQNGTLIQASEEKLQSLEKENQTFKLELVHQREAYEKMKDDLIRNKEESVKATEEKLSAESAVKVAELKKKAEQKIGQIRKQLTSQMEEKDQAICSLRTNLEERTQVEAAKRQQIASLEEKAKTLEESIAKLKEDHERQLEQVQSDERQGKERSLEDLKNLFEEKLSSLQADACHEEAGKTLLKLEEIRKELRAADDLNVNLVAEIAKLKEELLEKSGLLEQHQATIASFEKPGQNQLEMENSVQAEMCFAEQTNSNTGKEMGNHFVTQDDVDPESVKLMQTKLAEAKNEKQKIQKDFTRLQKDLRSLRKEHEQELDYVKKELVEENEKRLKLELEDMEMKHKSALKQLMREVNAQMALKEKELETAVKDTIAKAQSVEAELMENHRDEAVQLKKLIAEKEDDLQRTVQKYEEVLQSREEEMGDRVWQVQKELEDLQRRANSNSQMSPEELQAQLAEKTTLLSEARLKEQEFIERIHSLEDKIKCVRKNPVVTHLGSPIKDPAYRSADALSEPTEYEYLRKVLFEYMMGRETKTMAKVITSILKFPPDQAQTVLEKEDSKATPWLRGTL